MRESGVMVSIIFEARTRSIALSDMFDARRRIG